MTTRWDYPGPHPRRGIRVPGADAGHADPAAKGCAAKLSNPHAPYHCTRLLGHPGRHMASIGGDHIIAAWPGTHAPTVADLSGAPAIPGQRSR